MTPARVSLRLRSADGDVYESVPLYLRPGSNENLRIPLDGNDFKSSKTGWKGYDASLDRSKSFKTGSTTCREKCSPSSGMMEVPGKVTGFPHHACWSSLR